jgi:tRNA modification GTPase
VHLDDTIVAIATPPGRGGIGVVRVAGADARSITRPLLRLKHLLEPGRAIFGDLIDPDSGERIDEVVVTFFAKPHSYTTDDIIEISSHGSPVVLRHLVELAIARGARIAEPGEFTMRAFLNGRIDLTQAEAVNDLIASQTLFQAKTAAQQLQGALSKRLQPIKEDLVQLIASLEAGVDFAEDDVSVLPPEKILERVEVIRNPLQRLADSFAYGKIVHEGLTLAIVGPPNVGKSSLFNRLVERDRAIVTATPGTTRDLVTETISLEGIPLRFVDTAGIRASNNEAESIGIRKSHEALAEADLVLAVFEATPDSARNGLPDWFSHEHPEISQTLTQRKLILVENKIDLIPRRTPNTSESTRILTSAVTGEGIEALREKIIESIRGQAQGEHESGFLTNLRQHTAVKEAIAGLEKSESAVRERVPHEMLLLDLYAALRALDGITGETTTDDILNSIFSSFCIGK